MRDGIASPRELGAVGAILTALVASELVLSGSWHLLTQTPWLDEGLTLMLVNDSSYGHVLSAVQGGVDTTPPGYYTVMWVIVRLFRGMSTVELRVVGCLFAILACVAVYGTCRLFVDRQRAALGALVVLIHPNLITQLFQVRFYTFWLAAIAWLVYFTARQTFEPDRKQFRYWRCALAVLVVGTHWFGVIVVGLITAADFLVNRSVRRRVDAALPMIVGAVALAAFLPFLAGQRTGLYVPTWIEPMSASGLARQLRAAVGIAPMAFIVGALLYRVVARDRWRTLPDQWAAAAPGFALLLFPAVLVILSVVMQPVAQAKYMFPLIVPVGILAALASPPANARGGRLIGGVAAVALIAVGALALNRFQNSSSPEISTLDRAVAVADSINAAGAGPVVFLRRAEHYPVLARRPGFAGVTAVVDFDRDGGGLSRMKVFERDMSRRVNRAYPEYRLARVDSLDRLDRFVVLTGPEADSVPRKLFPRHKILPTATGVYTALRR